MEQNLIDKIKAWLYDFGRKDKDQNYIISDGALLDDAKELFEDILKDLNV